MCVQNNENIDDVYRFLYWYWVNKNVGWRPNSKTGTCDEMQRISLEKIQHLDILANKPATKLK